MCIDRNEYYWSITMADYSPYDKEILEFSRLTQMQRILPGLDFTCHGKIITCSNSGNTCQFWVYQMHDEYYYINCCIGYYRCDQLDGLTEFLKNEILPRW
ncbi:hypothetical protein MgSA37_01242 [Mucilaginibacter gotjawali]|uniref:Uncharacterized protein n=2 Tax=Mucilaginibacter gotjawali TaxID=1550579 RepID=A0A839SFJ3_9SPHI|nr:hypothetical protein [Mucilaginibacter gotjawali]BAU53075.1 hypothetical protein MgSA37_01242 [Mucilaginibacter gotjawali]